MLSCPATYCNVNGSVCSPASVRNVCRKEGAAAALCKSRCWWTANDLSFRAAGLFLFRRQNHSIAGRVFLAHEGRSFQHVSLTRARRRLLDLRLAGDAREREG